MDMRLTNDDEKQLLEKGVSRDAILRQLSRFRDGFKSIDLIKPATIGDGILSLTEEEENKYISTFRKFEGTVSKFVPASGAATRMFKNLLDFRSKYSGSESDYKKFVANAKSDTFVFFKNLKHFAFYQDLKNVFASVHGYSIEDSLDNKEYLKILNILFDEELLNYLNLPKGLLPFHISDKHIRTPILEQLAEGLQHIPGHTLKVHFTVSPQHRDRFEQHIEQHKSDFNSGKQIEVTYSLQNPNTDTIAVKMNNEPVRDHFGNLLFRPAGHGALLANLNSLEQDIIFIKNIDNVLPDRHKNQSVKTKMILAGVLLDLQIRTFDLLHRNDEGEDVEEEAIEILSMIGTKGILSQDEAVKYLNRPMRVCGMVKNSGEPGGGPFWTLNNGLETLQIVESAQVNTHDLKIFNESTHFNPVDIVCGVKDYRGRKFDLSNFRDLDQGFISEKSYHGNSIKAMELPGLWNGSMSNWLTIFVEVPIETFSPVKTINDLLKEEHLSFND
jgi:hypothetical protein